MVTPISVVFRSSRANTPTYVSGKSFFDRSRTAAEIVSKGDGFGLTTTAESVEDWCPVLSYDERDSTRLRTLIDVQNQKQDI